MKLTFISDTHDKHNSVKVEPTDFLFHTGDATTKGTLTQVKSFLSWFEKQPAKYKIYVAGNHDWLFQKDPQAAKMLLSEHPDVIYLQDASITLEGLRIYGSPWQPWFYDWAFNANSDKLFLLWEKIPGNTDILLTHGPPHDILDLTKRNDKVGCEILRQNVLNRVKPRIHAFGHIHESRGTLKVGDTTFVNSSCLDERYSFKNEPIVMEI